MKNVKVILTGVALCATLFAANQRINALGGDSGFWPNDRDNINYFPSTINDHAFVEVDGVGSAGGDTTATGESNDITATVLFGDDTKWGFSYDKADSDSWFNIMWGSGDMGIKGGLISSSEDADAEGNSGFNFAYGQNFSWGELGVGLVSGAHDADGAFNNDQMDYWLNWRGDLGFWIFDQSKASLMMTDDGADHTTMDLGFDMFTHMDAGGADVLFGMGVGYTSNSNAGTWDDDDDAGTVEVAYDATSTVLTLPSATVAVEADITDWATFRCFVNTDYTISSSLEDDDSQTSYAADGYTGASSSFGMGLGFNWGGLTADMNVSENLLQDPISYMTGFNGDDNTLTNYGVTLTYSF